MFNFFYFVIRNYLNEDYFKNKDIKEFIDILDDEEEREDNPVLDK